MELFDLPIFEKVPAFQALMDSVDFLRLRSLYVRRVQVEIAFGARAVSKVAASLHAWVKGELISN